jgi:ABC-type tungstate transport system substrate-binding protein
MWRPGRKRLAGLIVIAVGVSMMVGGLIAGEAARVLGNAVSLCLGCIGIG